MSLMMYWILFWKPQIHSREIWGQAFSTYLGYVPFSTCLEIGVWYSHTPGPQGYHKKWITLFYMNIIIRIAKLEILKGKAYQCIKDCTKRSLLVVKTLNSVLSILKKNILFFDLSIWQKIINSQKKPKKWIQNMPKNCPWNDCFRSERIYK